MTTRSTSTHSRVRRLPFGTCTAKCDWPKSRSLARDGRPRAVPTAIIEAAADRTTAARCSHGTESRCARRSR
eukprot:729030-Pyramimonas_sp.AAC.1